MYTVIQNISRSRKRVDLTCLKKSKRVKDLYVKSHYAQKD